MPKIYECPGCKKQQMERKGIGWYKCPKCGIEILEPFDPEALVPAPEPDADPNRHEKTVASMLASSSGGSKSGRRRKKEQRRAKPRPLSEDEELIKKQNQRFLKQYRGL